MNSMIRVIPPRYSLRFKLLAYLRTYSWQKCLIYLLFSIWIYACAFGAYLLWTHIVGLSPSLSALLVAMNSVTAMTQLNELAKDLKQ
jgi:hypothetical protein